MIFISQLQTRQGKSGYPFIPLVRNTPQFNFTAPVTIWCGDNGCGKTTYAKILATAADCVCISRQRTAEEPFQNNKENFLAVRKLLPKRKFYFSAEEFVQFVRDVEERKQDAYDAIAQIRADTTMSDYAKALATSPHMETLQGFEDFYGTSLAKISHGQGFLTFFEKRLRQNGFYIIDEPEAALTTENQFLLAAKVHNAAKTQNCQFVICTHSPVVAAIPDADVYEVQQDKFVKTKWEDLSNVSFMSMFFKNKDRLF